MESKFTLLRILCCVSHYKVIVDGLHTKRGHTHMSYRLMWGIKQRDNPRYNKRICLELGHHAGRVREVASVRRMYFALLRECEGLFRRYADCTDTEDSSTIDFTDMSFLVISGVYGGARARGKYRDRCGDQWKEQDGICALLIHPSLSLV